MNKEQNGPVPKKTDTLKAAEQTMSQKIQDIVTQGSLSSTDPSLNTAEKFIGWNRQSAKGVRSVSDRYADLVKQGKISWEDANPFTNSSKSLEQLAADQQSFWDVTKNVFTGGLKTTAAGFIQSVGASYDIQNMIDTYSGNLERDASNWFTRTADALRESAQKEDTIYGTQGESTLGYWGNQFQQLGTSVGIMAHGFTEQALLSLITAGTGGAGSVAQATKLASTIRRMNLAKQFAFGSLKGITEAVMNSQETYSNIYNEYIQKDGVTHEQADRIAKEGATTHARMEAGPLVLLNGLQWATIGRYNPFAKTGLNQGFGGAFESVTDIIMPTVKNKFAKGAVGYGINMASESVEEGIQTGIGGYAHYAANKKYGGGEGKELWGDYIFTHELRDSMVGGALGGIVFKGMGDIFSRSTQAIRNVFGYNDDRIGQLNSMAENIAVAGQANLKNLADALKDGDAEKANRIRLRSNLTQAAAALKIDAARQDGSTVAFDSFINQMESTLAAVNANDKEALESLGLRDQNDLAFVKNSYGQMIQDAQAFKAAFDKEAPNSISHEIAEEKAHYTLMQDVAKRESVKAGKQADEALNKLVALENIPAAERSTVTTQLKIHALKEALTEIESVGISEDNKEIHTALQEALVANEEALNIQNQTAETLGQSPKNYAGISDKFEAVNFKQSYIMQTRLNSNQNVYRKLYSDLSSVKGQQERTVQHLKNKIASLVATTKDKTTEAELASTIEKGKANNVLSQQDEEKLQALLIDIQKEKANVTQTSNNLANDTSILAQVDARVQELNNERAEIIANAVPDSQTRIEQIDSELNSLAQQQQLLNTKINAVVPPARPSIEELVQQSAELDNPSSSSDSEQVTEEEEYDSPFGDDKQDSEEADQSLAPDPADRLMSLAPNAERISSINGLLASQTLSYSPIANASLGNAILDAATNTIKTLYNSIQAEIGDAPTFQMLLMDAINQSKNKNGVEQMFHAFVHGWRANNYPTTDFNEVYNTVFANRADLVNSLLQMGLETNPSAENTVQVASKENANQVAFNAENNTVVVPNEEGVKVVVPHTNSEVALFVPKAHYFTFGTGSMTSPKGNLVFHNLGSVGPFQNEFIDARPLLTPNGVKVDQELEVRVVPQDVQDRLPVTVYINGVKTTYPSFTQYVNDQGLTPDSPEWMENVPMIAYHKGTPTFFIHTPNYYNADTISLENPQEVINTARKGSIEFRQKVLANNGTLPIVITKRSQGEYKKFDASVDGVVSKPISDVDPTSAMGFLTDTSMVYYKQVGDTFVKEEAVAKDFNDSTGKRRQIINFDSIGKSNVGGFISGKAIHIRQGVNANQLVAAENYLQNIKSDELVNYVSKVLEVRSLRNFGPEYMAEFESFRKEVHQSYGLDIKNLQDFETLMKMFFNESSRVSKSSEEFVNTWNKPKTEYNVETFLFTTVNGEFVFTVSGRRFQNTMKGKPGRGMLISNYTSEYLANFSDADKAKHIEAVKSIVSQMKDSIKTAATRVKPSKRAFEVLSKTRKANSPIIGLTDNGNRVTVAENYMSFLMDNSHTGMQAFNVGTSDKPQYVTMVQPLIEYRAKDSAPIRSNFNNLYLAKPSSTRASITSKVSTTNADVPTIGELKGNVLTTNASALQQQTTDDVKDVAVAVIDTEFKSFLNKTQQDLFTQLEDKVGLSFTSVQEVENFLRQATPSTRGIQEVMSLMDKYNSNFTDVATKLFTILESKNIPTTFVAEYIQESGNKNPQFLELAKTFQYFAENGLLESSQDNLNITVEEAPKVKGESVPVELITDALVLAKELGLAANDPAVQFLTDLISDRMSYAPIGFNADVLDNIDGVTAVVKGLALNKTDHMVNFVHVFMGDMVTNAGKKGLNKAELFRAAKEALINKHVSEKRATANSVIERLRGYSNSPEFDAAIAKLSDTAEILNTIEASWENIAERAFMLLNKYRGTQEKTLMDVEIEEDLAQNSEVLSEDQTSDSNMQDKNYSKLSIEDNPKSTASYNLKKFLYSIEKVSNNNTPILGFLGLRTFVGFDVASDTISSLLSAERTVPSNFNAMVQVLQNNVKAYPWLQQVIDKLTDTTIDEHGILKNQQTRYEFTYHFARHALAMKFSTFEKDSSGKWKYKIYDTNAHEINRVITQTWRNNFKSSPLAGVDLDGAYTINLAVAKSLLAEFESFQTKKPDETTLSNFLMNFGIKMSPQALQDMLKASGSKSLFAISNSNTNIIPLLGSYLKDMASLPEGTKADFEMDKRFHPFGNAGKVMKKVVEFEKKYATYATTNSFRDGNKSVYGFTQTKLSTDMAADLKKADSKLRQRLLNNPYSKSSYIVDFLENDLKFREDFDVEHLGITAIKELNSKFGNSNTANSITDLADADHELTKLVMFMDTKQAESQSFVNDIPTRFARMFFPTMSDKSQMLMMTTPVLNLSTLHFKNIQDFSMENNLFDFVFEQLVQPDLNRMISFAQSRKDSSSKVTDIKGYDFAAQLFVTIPQLNNLVTPEGKSLIKEIQENPDKSVAQIKSEYGAIMKAMIESQFKAKVDQKIESWKKYGFVTETTNPQTGAIETSTAYLDSAYLATFDTNNTEAVRMAAINYVLNSRVANANMFMIFAGDLAQYSTGKASKYFYDGQIDKPKPLADVPNSSNIYAKVVKDILGVNLGKRLAALIAPGSKIAESENDSYIQLFLKDMKGITSNTEYLVRTFYGNEEAKVAKRMFDDYNAAQTVQEKENIAEDLKAKYPDLADYFDIEATDAQEYVTMQEQIDILTRQGRIDNATLATIKQKIELQTKAEQEGRPIPANAMLDYFELKVLMTPIKPVYTGSIEDKINGIERMMYIKTSSIPLIPQVTRGLELDKVRVMLDNLQRQSGKNVRASYESGNKVGHNTNAVDLFMADGTFNSTLLESSNMSFDDSPLKKSTLLLDRNNFRIQQDVPFKSAKRNEDTISIGTQTMKLLFGDGVVDFDFDGVSGRDLMNQYNNAFAEIINNKKEGLYKRLGLDKNGRAKDPSQSILKVHDLLKEEASLRGYPQQDLEALGVTQLEDGTWAFEVPIWLSMNSNRYESLLNSIVTNKLAKLKMPGSTFVVASEAGFKMQGDFNGIDQSKVIYTSSWVGELQAANVVEDENGKRVVKSAQVLLPSKFRMPDGSLFNFFDSNGNPKSQYTFRDENGVLRLKEDMIDKETLLSMTSFRIPTSSHVSISQIEVVGILPTEVADTMIVPKNLTKQKGLDFDIDKENVYQHYHYIDESGKIRRYSLAAVMNTDTEQEAQEVLQYAKDIMKAYYTQKGEERALTDLLDEKDKLYEYGVEEEHFLLKDVKHAINKLQAKIADKVEVDPELVEDAKKILRVVTSPKFAEKIAFNKILDIHKQVMTHPDMDKKTNKILSMDVAKSQAEFISSQAAVNTSLENFSLTDDDYQIHKMGLGAAGKLGIGVYSNYVVFHSLVQQSSQPLHITTVADTETVPLSLTICGVKSDGLLGSERTLGLGNEKGRRTVTEVLAERQNTATDNEKEQIMGLVNINEVTINVDSLLVALGFDLVSYGDGKEVSLPYLFLSQPVIKDYVDILRSLKANTSSFNGPINTEAERQIRAKYKTTKATLNTENILANLSPEQMISELSVPSADAQIAVFESFLKLRSQAEQVGKAQRLLNVNKDGLGKSFFEATQKYADLENLLDSGIGATISNIDKLIGDFQSLNTGTAKNSIDLERAGYIAVGNTYIKPTTAVGHMLVNTLKVGQDLWGGLLPYNDPALSTIFNSIIGISQGEESISSAQRIEFQQEIFSELKKFLYSNYDFGFYEALEDADNSYIPAQEERRRLFLDLPGKPSLASYLNSLKSMDNSDLNTQEGIEKIKDNPLMQRFKFEIDRTLNKPSMIQFDNTKGEAFDEEQYYNSILMLLEDDLLLPSFGGYEYSTRQLASDLMAYAFLEGGQQEAIQFVKYIPMSLLKKTNFGKIVRGYNKEAIDGGLFSAITGLYKGVHASPFITQYFQHNPKRATKVNAKELIKVGETNEILTTRPDAEINSPFITFYEKGKPVLYKYDVSSNYYKKLDVLDVFGMNQYSQGVPEVKTILGAINNHEVPVNPPTAVEGLGNPVITPSSSSSKPFTTDRFGLSENVVMEAYDFINNLVENGEAANFLPGLKSILTQFSKVLKTSGVKVSVSDTVTNQGQTYNLDEISAKAVYNPSQEGLKGEVIVSPSFFRSATNEQFIKTLAHEIVHASTQNYIEQYYTRSGQLLQNITEEDVPQAVRDLKALFLQAQTMFSAHEIASAKSRFKLQGHPDHPLASLSEREVETVYGVFDLFEFSAMAMTEPAFQQMLAKKMVPDTNISFKDKFLEILRKICGEIVGFDFDNYPDSLLSKTITTVLKIAQEDKVARQEEARNENVFSDAHSAKIENALRQANQLTDRVETVKGLDIGEGTAGFIPGTNFALYPMSFSDDILSPSITKEDISNKPSC